MSPTTARTALVEAAGAKRAGSPALAFEAGPCAGAGVCWPGACAMEAHSIVVRRVPLVSIALSFGRRIDGVASKRVSEGHALASSEGSPHPLRR